MANSIPASKQVLQEAQELAGDIVKNIELSEISLEKCALKAARLARITNDFEMEKLFQFEVSGYLHRPDGVGPEDWKRAGLAERHYQKKDTKTQETKTYMFLESIGQLEETLEVQKISLEAAKDPNVSISSANPNQYVSQFGNGIERNNIRQNITNISQRIASRRAIIYQYATKIYYEIKFSGIADDVFARIRERADSRIGEVIPDSIKKFSAIYDNMRSDNPEDWSNAVHSCRRILQDLADQLFPAQADRIVESVGKSKTIKMGPDQYINRLMAYAEDNSESERFQDIVGSHLRFLGERLDSIFKAAQKGSHSTIIDKREADRYIAYTYMVVGDILTLRDKGVTQAV